MRSSIIDIELAKKLITTNKLFTENVVMQTEGAKCQYSKFTAPVLYANGDNVVGLSLRFESNRSQGYRIHRLGLMFREGSLLNPIIDLCFYPNYTRAHMDKAKRETIYGSHVHILNDVKKLDVNYDKCNWMDYLGMFAKQANVNFSSCKIVQPFEGELL
jgi:hypothetical protein